MHAPIADLNSRWARIAPLDLASGYTVESPSHEAWGLNVGYALVPRRAVALRATTFLTLSGHPSGCA